jgi:hypothetical protein
MYDRQSTINTGEEGAIGNWKLDGFLLQGLMLLLRLQLIGALNLGLILRVCAEHSEFTIQSYKNYGVTSLHYMSMIAFRG